jgi:hypothetical protein
MKTKLIAAFAALLALTPAALAALAAPVTLTAKLAPIVVLPVGEENVTVPVTLTLANPSDQPATLKASNKCEINIWSVTDASGGEVTNHGICMMIYQPQSNTLAPGASQTAEESISLHAADYREDESYTLQYRFWGVSAQAAFAVKQGQ